MIVYFGTYTRESSQGIYRSDFDPEHGTLTPPTLAAKAASPTFLSTDAAARFLYATGELLLDPMPKPALGGATAYAIERPSGSLRWLNQEATGGGGTVHSQVDATTRALVIANYHTGYVAAVPILADGRVGPRSAYFPHEGVAPLGPNRARQDRPHPHCIILSPDDHFAFSCDLGQDRIYSYRLDPAHATLQPNDPPFGIAEPGSGPRHGIFSPDSKYLYVANELNGTVTLYRHDAPRGALTLVQSYPTLPEGFSGENTVGEIDLHPNGKYLYVSNRGHDSIAVFVRDPASGRLERKEIVACGGKHPRTFTVAPNGRWLLCGNKDTNNVVVFALDPATGRITAAGREVSVPEVVCVLIV